VRPAAAEAVRVLPVSSRTDQRIATATALPPMLNTLHFLTAHATEAWIGVLNREYLALRLARVQALLSSRGGGPDRGTAVPW
jgi:hypothetical protein